MGSTTRSKSFGSSDHSKAPIATAEGFMPECSSATVEIMTEVPVSRSLAGNSPSGSTLHNTNRPEYKMALRH